MPCILLRRMSEVLSIEIRDQHIAKVLVLEME